MEGKSGELIQQIAVDARDSRAVYLPLSLLVEQPIFMIGWLSARRPGTGKAFTTAVVANPVASLRMGDLRKAVVTHGKASADLCKSQLKGRAKPIR